MQTDGIFNILMSGGGAVLGVFVLKLAFPFIKTTWQAATANNVAQSKIYEYFQEELDKCRERDKKYQDMILQVADLQSQLANAKYLIEEQSRELEAMRTEINRLKSVKGASS